MGSAAPPPSVEPHVDNSGLASEGEIQDAVDRGWRLQRGALVRDLEFRDFDEAIAFAQVLGREAVDWLRRPDMLIRSHHLRLSVMNLHHAGLTKAELGLVSKATAVIEDHDGH
ncbi:MAG TPA: 4a-hydroxytetrahydrobiopterin dehydratase [Thermoleophilaceae bacterium]|nr:4a-hydroxytetrahydrobiopterin dehydratase [Thermoleophilaceae bacterium]